jgi:hypothetical protein
MQRREPDMIGLVIGHRSARFDVTGGVDTGGVDTGGVDRTDRARAANVLNTF